VTVGFFLFSDNVVVFVKVNRFLWCMLSDISATAIMLA